MSKGSLIVGLDIGTSLTKIAVARQLRPDKDPSIIALGVSNSEGLRRGVVVDIQDATRSILVASESAGKMIEDDISGVILSLNGGHITCRESMGKVAVSRADGEVTEEDVSRVYVNANPGPSSQNKQVIDIVPKTFILDEETGIKNPVGMNGIRLELDALVIEGNTSALKNVEKCVEAAGLHIEAEEIGIISAGRSVLSKKQRDLGVAVIDIGSGTTSIAVYEEGRLIHVAVIPVGSGHITNDIAIGLRTSIEVAEKVKLKYGYAFEDELGSDAQLKVDLSKIHQEEVGVFPISYVAGIIEARMQEIFDLVKKELQSIQREGLLPAGVVLVGGGANLRAITELAKRELKLPIKIGIPEGVEGSIADVDNPIYATLVGLVLNGFTQGEESNYENGGHSSSNSQNKTPSVFQKILAPMKGLIKTMLPE